MEKFERLRDAVAGKGRLLVLFSGGLDSTVLAKLAHDVLGDDSCALTFDSSIMPSGDLGEARSLAALIGIDHVVIRTDELSDPEFSLNPPHRCYLCRKMRNAQGLAWAREKDFTSVADGLNASDLSDYRPGMKAAREDHIWQPFAELGITKEEIRALARDLGLTVWDKPNTVCLCSRFPYGMAIREELLRRVEAAEEFLKGFGLRNIRVRSFPYDTAVIEVDNPVEVIQYKERIIHQIKSLGFSFVTLDLEGFRSGKLNKTLE